MVSLRTCALQRNYTKKVSPGDAMSNFSNIGFDFSSLDELKRALASASDRIVAAPDNFYLTYADPSGAELWLQLNEEQRIVGFNPHFSGASRRPVSLTHPVFEDSETNLDGFFYAWALNSQDTPGDTDGLYPFVFSVPDFNSIEPFEFPRTVEIQLSAFAHALAIFKNEEEYHNHPDSKVASQAFIPSGLFSPDGETTNPPSPEGVFTGIVRDWAKKRNELTQADFYWLLVDTYGGSVDVVAEPSFFAAEPEINGVVKGHFWLSGRLHI